jgi:tetratricopeptide (TPR) repeat protein
VAFPNAKRAAHEALARQPGLVEAYPAIAYAAMYYDWDWQGAERAFRRAIELHPGYANAHQWYANFLSIMGRADESIAEFERSLALDPLSALKHASLGWGYYFARRFERGVEECRRGIELEPGNMVAHAWLAMGLEAMGRTEEAVLRAEETASLANRGVASLGFLGHAYAVAGRVEDARAVLGEMLRIGETRYVSPYDIALTHLGLGEEEEAMGWLERGYEGRDHQMVFLKVDPRLDALRGRRDFGRLMERMRY